MDALRDVLTASIMPRPFAQQKVLFNECYYNPRPP